MKYMKHITLLLIVLPILGFAQLKTNVTKPNISETLETGTSNDAFVGFLDPSRIHMSHSLSMSYMSFGGGGAVVNSYVNTLNYKFSDDLFLTTNIGIMNTPYSTLPGNEDQNGYERTGRERSGEEERRKGSRRGRGKGKRGREGRGGE